MIFAASLVLAIVSALPIQSPQCLKSHNLIRIYSEGACDDSGEWVEFEPSSHGITGYGQSVKLDLSCDTVSAIYVPHGSGQSKLGEFPHTARCISLEAPHELTIESHAIPNLLEFSFDSLFSRRDAALQKRSDDIVKRHVNDGPENTEQGGPDDEDLVVKREWYTDGDADCEDNCGDIKKRSVEVVKRHVNNGPGDTDQGGPDDEDLVVKRHVNNGPGDTDQGGPDDVDLVVKREWYTDGDADCEDNCGDIKKRSDDESDDESD